MSEKTPKKFFYVSISIFLMLSIFTLIIFLSAKSELEKEYNDQVEIMGELTVKNFKESVFNNITYLENLKERIVESDGDYFKYWKNDANRIIDQNPALKFIEYIDSNGIIKEIVPLEPNKEALNIDIKKLSYRYPEWKKHSKTKTTNITNWIKLTQGGYVFLVDVPIYYDEEFQGTITAGMDFKDPFNSISSSLDEHSVTIKDDQGTVFYSYTNIQPKNHENATAYNSVVTIDRLDKNKWNFNFLYNQNQGFKDRQFVQRTGFIFGLILSFFIGLLVLFFLKVDEKAKELTIANDNLKQLNAKIRKERERATKASNAKTQFLSNMSHEIRTPLNAILGIADVIHINDMSEENKNYVTLLRNSSKSLLALVNDILDIDKIEMGKTELIESYFQPKNTLQKIVKTYEHEILNKDLKFIVNFPDEPSPMVVGHHSKTIQIFTNLLNNAIKFTNSGSIQVDYYEEVIDDALYFQFTIKDTGIGISKDKLPLVFDRFVQIDVGTRKKRGGSGLGLAITKGLVDFLKGSILVKSEINKGTKFDVKLSFPIADSFSEEEIGYLKLTGIKTLIVDDNKINTIVLKKMLSQSNLEADIALSGKECLLKVDQTKYDLIFMDVHMPNIDGFEIVEQIRVHNKDTIIFGFSADVTREAISKGKKVGMNEYLIKPIDQKRLFYLLAKYFKK
jgi:signal transduction histidine kinase/CheY-like chemotaxis protein|tara:strand:- start:147767 stop:149800 length:2034 start_codon:yes stop_codon:yes gene_type:complete